MMQHIDKLLNSVTMYRLTLYYLILLAGVAFVLSFVDLVPNTPVSLLLGISISVFTCYLTNFVCAKIFHAVTNVESVFISALILALIIPLNLPENLVFIVVASALSMASKYLFTIEKQHIFNPVAIAIAYLSFFSGSYAATWWIGTPAMLPFVLGGGLLLMRKIRREVMVLTYLGIYLGIVIAMAFARTPSIDILLSTFISSVTHTAVFFLAFIMLTEPMSSPATEKQQIIYASIVGLLNATPQLRLGIVLTPELALCVGNIFSYIVSPKYRLNLALKEKNQLTADTIEFIFESPTQFSFTAGQYMEWTLPHQNADNRGVRRYFSLANSPTEANLRLLVKFYSPSSSYKRQLFKLQKGEQIVASQLAGDFTLPRQLSQPLVLVSGGVGVAPFRSMIKHIVDNKLQVNIIHLFSNRTMYDIVYKELFSEAEQYGVHTVYLLTDEKQIPESWSGERGYITSQMIERVIPDYKKRKFYVSGPQLMVQTIEQTLLSAGVSKRQLKTDFFPGYVEKTS